MARYPGDLYFTSDMELASAQTFNIFENKNPDLCQQVVDLRADVDRLSDCLRDSLTMQQSMLKEWDRLKKENPIPPTVLQFPAPPIATSTPHIPAMNRAENAVITSNTNSFLPTNPLVSSVT